MKIIVKNFAEMNTERALHSSVFLPSKKKKKKKKKKKEKKKERKKERKKKKKERKKKGKYFWNTPSSSVFKSTMRHCYHEFMC